VNDIDLKVYLLDLMKAERRRLDQREKMRAEQLRLQHREYKRRLDDLNHEAERIALIQENYVPRETYDAYVLRQEEEATRLREAVNLAAGGRIGSGELLTRLATFAAIIAAIIAYVHG
jgi:hypothetical protein